MTRPVVGVIGSARNAGDGPPMQQAAVRYLRAASEAAGALPLMFAGHPDLTDTATLVDTVDGVLLTGGRANVHPSHYGTEAGPAYEPYDRNRDVVAIEVARACVAAGIPVLGICRGMQELNVAFGGSLHPEIRDLPGRMNHRMPRLENGEPHPDPAIVFAERHEVSLVTGGAFARLFGTETIRVNSLHGQGVLEPGARVVIEGLAEDGTVEAIRIADAPGFALGVQWHAEHEASSNVVNRTLFGAFGAAMAARREARQSGQGQAASAARQR